MVPVRDMVQANRYRVAEGGARSARRRSAGQRRRRSYRGNFTTLHFRTCQKNTYLIAPGSRKRCAVRSYFTANSVPKQPSLGQQFGKIDARKRRASRQTLRGKNSHHTSQIHLPYCCLTFAADSVAQTRRSHARLGYYRFRKSVSAVLPAERPVSLHREWNGSHSIFPRHFQQTFFAALAR